ncbi:MAG: biotin/lipoyl-binding protein [Prevotella sp.]|nr:biotin/lipoyl-binding protein [Prevotella sp.]
MSRKSQHNNILLAVAGFSAVVFLVGILGFFFLGKTDEVIQGQVDCDDYRVSSKLPARVVEIRVKEGDYVHVGDTLAILQVPEVKAQEQAAQATDEAAKAISDLSNNGNRQEVIGTAREVYRQAVAAAEIAQKTFMRMDNLYKEGVITAQKRDEAQAAFKATQAQVAAAKEQLKLAQDGSREEEKRAAAKQAQAAGHAVDVVKGLLKETVQISAVEGEVSDVYSHEGELVGMGSPIMSISLIKDMWGSFNVREDQFNGMKIGSVIHAFVPAFNKTIRMKVYYVKDQGSYAAWRSTKNSGQYDLKTLEVKARPIDKIDGVRPGMSLVLKNADKK